MTDSEQSRMHELIERSSLGTPEAKKLRASVSQEQVNKVMERLKQIEADRETAEILMSVVADSLLVVADFMELQNPMNFEGMLPWDWCRWQAGKIQGKIDSNG